MIFSLSSKKHNLIINLVLALFPIAFIGGNFSVNANLCIFCILGLFFIKKHDFQIFKERKILIISIFFIYLLIISFYYDSSNQQIEKSLLYFRYLLFFLIAAVLMKNKVLNLNFLFFSSLICSFLVSLDILYQFINGYDLFGFKKTLYHSSGPFNTEAMAGGYLMNFFPLGIASILFFSDILKKYFSITFIIFFSIISFGIIFSGNRMPCVLLVGLVFLLIVFIKKIRPQLIISLVLCSMVFTFVFKTDYNFRVNWTSFFENSKFIGKTLIKEEFSNKKSSEIEYIIANKVVNKENKHKNYPMGSGHIQTYLTSLDIIKGNVIFGQGIRSFRILCNKFINYETGERQINRICNTHPHNYYLEIVSDTGLVGLLILSLFMYLIFKEKINLIVKNPNINYLNIILLIVLLITIFPLKSTGSFFSTQSSTYLFLIVSLLSSRKLS